MQIQENVKVGPKTTMRVGGVARYYAQLETKEDVEQAVEFAHSKHVPLIMLGNGSNTVFADGVIDALVVQIKVSSISVDGQTVRVNCGKNLAMLINELADKDLDLSALTGIPGTVGGAIFGNAGQGPKGTWIDTYIREVTVFMNGNWQTLSKEDCRFRYRESRFKEEKDTCILWEAVLEVPSRPAAEVKANVATLLQKRIDTQPHLKTAGSCFKAIGDKPAWQLIDAVGLRGYKVGDAQIAEKHANFLLNTGKATYGDLKTLVTTVQEKVNSPLEVEMRFIEPDGTLAF